MEDSSLFFIKKHAKKTYALLFFMLIPSVLLGQNVLSLSCHKLRPGDQLQKQQVVYKSPGETGVHQLWDFSQMESVDEDYRLKYISINAGTDTVAGVEHRTMYYYYLRGDSLFLSGYENPTTLVKYRKPEVLLVFPFPYGQTFTDYFEGLGNYCGRLGIHIEGKSVVTADALGVMMLPEGDTLRQVLRVHTKKSIIERSVPMDSLAYLRIDTLSFVLNQDSIDYHLSNDSVHWELNTWRWYAKGYRYPVFESVHSTVCKSSKKYTNFSTSFYYPPHEQYYGLENDSENQDMRNRIEEDIEVFPKNNLSVKEKNGADDEAIHYTYSMNEQGILLNYLLRTPSEVTVGLYDLQGRQLSATKKTFQNKGSYQRQFILRDFSIREFLLRISVGDKVYGEKILNVY